MSTNTQKPSRMFTATCNIKNLETAQTVSQQMNGLTIDHCSGIKRRRPQTHATWVGAKNITMLPEKVSLKRLHHYGVIPFMLHSRKANLQGWKTAVGGTDRSGGGCDPVNEGDGLFHILFVSDYTNPCVR